MLTVSLHTICSANNTSRDCSHGSLSFHLRQRGVHPGFFLQLLLRPYRWKTTVEKALLHLQVVRFRPAKHGYLLRRPDVQPGPTPVGPHCLLLCTTSSRCAALDGVVHRGRRVGTAAVGTRAGREPIRILRLGVRMRGPMGVQCGRAEFFFIASNELILPLI